MPKTLQETIQDILSDVKIFKIGYSAPSNDITKTVIKEIRTSYPIFSNETNENIAHHTRKLLEVHNNHCENNYHDDYKGTRTRDISRVKITSNRYLYTFGMLLE